jgi:LacI family transcriptional regulator
MKKEATIYDIAKELGISPATVSRALSGHSATNSKTKEKVNKLASELGYQSNRFASSLRKQKSNNIGVIVHRLNSFVMSSILAGMESVVNKNGYNLIISQSLESKDKEVENAKTFFNSRIDALMISFSFDTDNLNHILPFIEKKIPVVFFDRIMDHPSCTSIVIDNYKEGYNVTKHLIDQGCKRLLHVTGSLQRNVYGDRLRGFEFALRESKLTYNSDSLLVTRFDDETPRMVLEKIKSMDQAPDGIFFANDYSAAATIILLKKNGYRIPEDIAIVGFNDEPIAKIVEPNLSSVHYPAKEMGEVAAQTIINYLKGSANVSQGSSIILRSETFFRPSSLRLKGQDD